MSRCTRCRSRQLLLEQLRKDALAYKAALQAVQPDHPLLTEGTTP